MKRRKFLQYTGSTAAVSAIAPQILGGQKVFATSPVDMLGSSAVENDAVLIVIQLFGGNDGINTVIPAEDPLYHEFRPNIGLDETQAIRIQDSSVFLHPALVNTHNNGLMGLFNEGRLAVIQGVGYDNPNLSHFRSTDIFLSGFNSSANDFRFTDGWLGRYFVERLPEFPQVTPPHPLSVQIGGTLSLLLRSQKGDTGITLTDPDAFFELGSGLSPDEQRIDDDTAYANEFNFIRQVAIDSDRYSQVVKQAFDNGENTLTYAEGFPQSMRLVARLISGGLRSKVFLVRMGGFDNHVQQVSQERTEGLHANLLNTLATGISQFMSDAVAQGFADRVVGITTSEFGRRPRENGSRGTDHGAASVQFVFGTKVNGAVYGQNPDFANLEANNQVFEFDYRMVYTDIMRTWFGATVDETIAILGEEITPLPVLQRPVSVGSPLRRGTNGEITVFPNPSRGIAQASFELIAPANIDLAVFSVQGRRISTIYKGALGAGLHRFPVQAYQSGSYIISLRAGAHRFTSNFTVAL